MLEIVICDDVSAHASRAKEITLEYFRGLGETARIELCPPYAFLALLDESSFSYNIAILDIELSMGEDGIELAKRINRKSSFCQIIFLSNYPKYMIDVYETDHIYFVPKKTVTHALPMALKRAQERIQASADGPSIYLKAANETVRLFLEEMVYAEHSRRKTQIYTFKDVLTVTDTMASLEKQCAAFPAIIRCHNSFLVHLKYVNRFSRNQITLHDGAEIPISRRYLTSTKSAFMHYIHDKTEL